MEWNGWHYGELLLLLGHLKLPFQTIDLFLLICNLLRLFAPLTLVLEKRIYALFEDPILVFKMSFLFLSSLQFFVQLAFFLHLGAQLILSRNFCNMLQSKQDCLLGVVLVILQSA